MAPCPACYQTYIHGEIICSHCGANLDEPKTPEEQAPQTQYLPVLGVEQGLIHVGPMISLHVIKIDDMEFPEGVHVALIPVSRLELPVRIGRRDLNENPTIRPELDLSEILTALQPRTRPIISRLHAALQLDAGRPAVKALVDLNGTTWVRHSGDDRLSPIPPNTVRPLEHRDILVLGHPKGRHVSLRVDLSHP